MDLIDRDKALAETWKEPNYTDPMNVLTEIRDRLKALPSEQSEIIRCKDCKWCENVDGSMCKNPASWVVATDRDFGCVLAERRADD